MARKSDPLSDSFGSDDTDGWLGGIVADEDQLDRQTLWRLGLWGFAAIGALTLGIMSGQLPLAAQRTQLAADDIAGRAKQVEAKVQENLLEARRLSAAIETLNGDRDRLFTRLSNLEQGLDVVTGSIKKTEDKTAAPPWPEVTPLVLNSAPAAILLTPQPAPAPAPLPVAVAPAPPVAAIAPATGTETDTTAAVRVEPPAEPAIARPPLTVQALPIPDAKPPADDANSRVVEEQPVAVADFAIDLGAANSINGLRALWRGLLKSHKAQLEGLRPLIAVRERRNGLGLQLRLIAGPIKDAAAAAQICAVLSDADRDCATAPFDGQRLSVASESETRPQAAPRPPAKRRPAAARAPEAAQAKASQGSSISSMLGFR